MSFEFWYMFPVSVAVASVAMASGVEGATFFAPIFILGLKVSPEVAIGTGLLTEVFGFASGLTAYVRMKVIDYRLGVVLLVATLPLAVVGTWLGGRVDADLLKVVLGMGLVAVAMSFLRAPDPQQLADVDAAIKDGTRRPTTCLAASDGQQICYTIVKKGEGMLTAGIGALFMGMVSTGLGEMNGYFLIQRCRVPSRVAVATSVFVVAITALVAATGHVVRFANAGGDELSTVLAIAAFTVPGVILGGQLGAKLGARIGQHTLEKALGILFVIVGAFMLGEVFLQSRG